MLAEILSMYEQKAKDRFNNPDGNRNRYHLLERLCQRQRPHDFPKCSILCLLYLDTDASPLRLDCQTEERPAIERRFTPTTRPERPGTKAARRAA